MSVRLPRRHSAVDSALYAVGRYVRDLCAEHYPVVPLGTVAQVTSGATPSTRKSEYWNGDILWVTPKDLGSNETIEVGESERKITPAGLDASSAKLLPEGAVLLSSRAPIGYLAIAAKPLATNQGFKNIIPGDRLRSRYLYHVLRASVDDIKDQGRGNTFAEIPARVVRQLPIPLPPPDIQQAIETFCDAVFQAAADAREPDLPALPKILSEATLEARRALAIAARIERIRRLHVRTAGEIATLRQAMIAGQIGANGQEGALRTIRADEMRGSPEWLTIDEADIDINPENREPAAADYPSGTFEYVSISSLPNHPSIVHGGETTPTNEAPSRARRVIRAGDVIFSSVRPYLRSVAVVGEELDGQICSTGFAVFRCAKSIDSRFLALQLASPLFIDQCMRKATGAHYPAINLTNLRKLYIWVPSLDSQHAVVESLQEIEAKIGKLLDLHEGIEAALEALVSSAFR